LLKYKALKRYFSAGDSVVLTGPMAEVWAALEHASPAQPAYDEKLGGRLSEVGCVAEGAPYVILGILERLDRLRTSVAARFLDEKHCPGAAKLPEDAKLKLRESRDPERQKSDQ